MKEIEVKVIEIDKEETVRKLMKLGAMQIYDGEMLSTIYDTTDGKLKGRGKHL